MVETNSQHISERIAAALEYTGLSARHVSKEAKLSPDYISKLLRRRSDPGTEKLEKIAAVLGMTAEALRSGQFLMGKDRVAQNINAHSLALNLRAIAIAAHELDDAIPGLGLFDDETEIQPWWLHISEALILGLEASLEGATAAGVEAALSQSTLGPLASQKDPKRGTGQ